MRAMWRLPWRTPNATFLFFSNRENGPNGQVSVMHFSLPEDMRQSQGGINWNTASGGDFLCRHLTCGYGPPGAPKGTVSVRGGNVRRASRRKAASARASRHDAVHRAHPAGPALRACSARQSSLRTHGRGPRRCQPAMLDAADAHAVAVPLERWRGTPGAVKTRSRVTELASRVVGECWHPSVSAGRGHAAWPHRRREVESSSDAVHYVLPPCV